MRLDTHPEISDRLAAHRARVVRARRDDAEDRRGHPARHREPLRGLAATSGWAAARTSRRRTSARLAAWAERPRPRDRARDPVALALVLHRLRAPRAGRGPGHGVARLLLPVERGVVPRPLRRDGRVPRRAAARSASTSATTSGARVPSARAAAARTRAASTRRTCCASSGTSPRRGSRRGCGATTSWTATTASGRAGRRAASCATSARTRRPPARSSPPATKDAPRHELVGRGGRRAPSGRLGWPFVIGNLQGTAEKDWAGRIARGGALGGEVSSWSALEEFQLGKLHFPEALFSANLLWSGATASREDALAEVGAPARGDAGAPRRRAAAVAARAPDALRGAGPRLRREPRAEGRRLGSLRPASPARPSPTACRSGSRTRRSAADARASSSAAAPARSRRPSTSGSAADGPRSCSCSRRPAAGAPPIHAGDQTHFPRESSELLGLYEIRFADGVVETHGIRYDENVGRWDAGLDGLYYFGRALVAGSLPDGRDAVVWATEWTNPRPDVPDRLGAAGRRAGPVGGASDPARGHRRREAAGGGREIAATPGGGTMTKERTGLGLTAARGGGAGGPRFD